MRVFGFCFLMLVAGCVAAPLPKAVLDDIRVSEEACYASSKKGDPLKASPAIVQKADLNGDGLPDFIFSDAEVPCELGASARNGNGGAGVRVYVGTPEGAALAYSGRVWGYRVERAADRTTAWVMVGGRYCGQKYFASKADAVSCERALVWHPAARKFELAPLSGRPSYVNQ